jgi:hypothetical protein
VGVRPDQQGVGWSIIGLGGVDLDARPPVAGSVTEIRAVGEVEQDRPRGVHELRNAGCALIGLQDEVRRVAAGDQLSHVSQWLLVHRQFQKELPQCVGGRVLSAPQCHLSLGLQHPTRAGHVALAGIRVQQALRCPAVDVGGQLPGKIDRVKHAEVDTDAEYPNVWNALGTIHTPDRGV